MKYDYFKISILMNKYNCLFFLGSCNTQKSTDKPNVLIICTDEWRVQSTGYCGDKDAKRPHLDNFATSIANFVNAISGIPVCTYSLDAQFPSNLLIRFKVMKESFIYVSGYCVIYFFSLYCLICL